ncbi:MAG: DsbA family oxidoreductase [Halioglobus sp.]
MTTSAMPLQVDVVSDVVCPWCIVGYLQLQSALAQMPGEFDVSLRWHPFELNPQMPEEGQGLREHLVEKYGPAAGRGSGGRQRLIELGKSLGFEFNYFDGMRIYNTFKAHQLLAWAQEQTKQTELKLALFDAFFTRRENVGDAQQLSVVCERVGLSRIGALDVLEQGIFAAPVRAEESQWLEREVHAVPAFFFQNSYMVSGAQEAQSFVRFLTRIKQRELAAAPH